MRAVSVAICLFVLGCASDQSPTVLLGDLRSRLSVGQVRDVLKTPDANWRIVEDNKPSNVPKDAPYHFVSISIREFSDLGEQGELRLQFFNDRLMGAWFYPSRPDVYVAKLAKERNIIVAQGGKTEASAHTRIRLANDYAGRTYIAYEDANLEREHDDWISRHS